MTNVQVPTWTTTHTNNTTCF